MSMKKTLIEIGVVLGVVLILNVTGLFGEVTGALQRSVMLTGIMDVDVEEKKNSKEAEYDFELITLEGKKISLEQYKGKVIFLNLWATWCGPCIAEMPGIQSLYEDVQDNENIEFVMVSLDDAMSKPQKFIDRKDFTFPVYMPGNGIPDIYRTGAIPTTHIIDKEGNIVFSKRGTANYDTRKFRKYLEELSGK